MGLGSPVVDFKPDSVWLSFHWTATLFQKSPSLPTAAGPTCCEGFCRSAPKSRLNACGWRTPESVGASPGVSTTGVVAGKTGKAEDCPRPDLRAGRAEAGSDFGEKTTA